MPRKSNVSHLSAAADEGTPAKEKDGVNIEDLSLPRSMVQRLAKGVLPPNTQIQKDAITAMSKGATVFVNHIADKANEITLSTNRKTISPTAVLEALAECEFSEFLPRVEAELKRFNEIATGKRNEYRRKVKEKEMGVNGSTGSKDGDGSQNGANLGMRADEEQEGGDGERATKRIRREEGDEALLAGQLRQEAGEPNGAADEGAMRDVLGVEDNEAEREQLRPGEDEDAEDDDDDVSDEEAEQESEGAESDSGSGMDMDARLRAIQDGLGSEVDVSGSDDESD
ncbi:MAG: hypothetical protein Q9207_001518 [Kuettlingeria erythrocarpa]